MKSQSKTFPSSSARCAESERECEEERRERKVDLVECVVVFVQVIDAHVGEEGEVIANIPIRVTAKAVFSK